MFLADFFSSEQIRYFNLNMWLNKHLIKIAELRFF